MIVFGVRPEAQTEPARQCITVGEQSCLVTVADEPINRAWNEISTVAASLDDLEAVVFVREQMADWGPFEAQLRAGLAQAADVTRLVDKTPLSSSSEPSVFGLALSIRAASELRVGEAMSFDAAVLDLAESAQTQGLRVNTWAYPSTSAEPPMSDSDRASGTRAGGQSTDDGYYGFERPEIVSLIPTTARRVLDVGCAGGALGAAVKRHIPAVEVTGLEYVPEVVQEAARRLDAAYQVDLNSLSELPIEHGYFDVMIFGDVLEHLLDPEETLRRLLPYLGENGIVVASIPNTVHWSVMIPALVQDRWEYTDAGLLDRTHVHLFTLQEALRMFATVGLTEVVQRGANVIPPPEPQLTEPLVKCVRAYGSTESDPGARFNVYQYILVIRRPR
ncbi:class I SAM-dependent methyltransferase [Austwickia chelonae]|uniref:class I SAM-dependent methyltransferase n=1 Tax=Austwickia chelonae TaxID=100225 RepID=UPI0013C34B14|nr:methyltransferase domain-containing protein [Austwickia chelonae]